MGGDVSLADLEAALATLSRSAQGRGDAGAGRGRHHRASSFSHASLSHSSRTPRSRSPLPPSPSARSAFAHSPSNQSPSPSARRSPSPSARSRSPAPTTRSPAPTTRSPNASRGSMHARSRSYHMGPTFAVPTAAGAVDGAAAGSGMRVGAGGVSDGANVGEGGGTRRGGHHRSRSINTTGGLCSTGGGGEAGEARAGGGGPGQSSSAGTGSTGSSLGGSSRRFLQRPLSFNAVQGLLLSRSGPRTPPPHLHLPPLPLSSDRLSPSPSSHALRSPQPSQQISPGYSPNLNASFGHAPSLNVRSRSPSPQVLSRVASTGSLVDEGDADGEAETERGRGRVRGGGRALEREGSRGEGRRSRGPSRSRSRTGGRRRGMGMGLSWSMGPARDAGEFDEDLRDWDGELLFRPHPHPHLFPPDRLLPSVAADGAVPAAAAGAAAGDGMEGDAGLLAPVDHTLAAAGRRAVDRDGYAGNAGHAGNARDRRAGGAGAPGHRRFVSDLFFDAPMDYFQPFLPSPANSSGASSPALDRLAPHTTQFELLSPHSGQFETSAPHTPRALHLDLTLPHPPSASHFDPHLPLSGSFELLASDRPSSDLAPHNPFTALENSSGMSHSSNSISLVHASASPLLPSAAPLPPRSSSRRKLLGERRGSSFKERRSLRDLSFGDDPAWLNPSLAPSSSPSASPPPPLPLSITPSRDTGSALAASSSSSSASRHRVAGSGSGSGGSRERAFNRSSSYGGHRRMFSGGEGLSGSRDLYPTGDKGSMRDSLGGGDIFLSARERAADAAGSTLQARGASSGEHALFPRGRSDRDLLFSEEGVRFAPPSGSLGSRDLLSASLHGSFVGSDEVEYREGAFGSLERVGGGDRGAGERRELVAFGSTEKETEGRPEKGERGERDAVEEAIGAASAVAAAAAAAAAAVFGGAAGSGATGLSAGGFRGGRERFGFLSSDFDFDLRTGPLYPDGPSEPTPSAETFLKPDAMGVQNGMCGQGVVQVVGSRSKGSSSSGARLVRGSGSAKERGEKEYRAREQGEVQFAARGIDERGGEEGGNGRWWEQIHCGMRSLEQMQQDACDAAMAAAAAAAAAADAASIVDCSSAELPGDAAAAAAAAAAPAACERTGEDIRTPGAQLKVEGAGRVGREAGDHQQGEDQQPQEPQQQEQEQARLGQAQQQKAQHPGAALFMGGGGSVLGRGLRELKEVYVVGRAPVGRGQYGTVRKCVHRGTGKAYACKSIGKRSLLSAAEKEAVRREVGFLERLKGHANIIRMKETIESTRHVHIIMEHCEGGDLLDRIQMHRNFPEPSAARIFRSLMRALQHCHAHGIVHRDVKPENVLIAHTSPLSSSSRPGAGHIAKSSSVGTSAGMGASSCNFSSDAVKLIDFGVATLYSPEKPCRDVIGTSEYMAPEVFDQSYGPESDVWSAGIVLFMLVIGRAPYSDPPSTGGSVAPEERPGWPSVLVAKEAGFYGVREWENLSAACKHLICWMLVKDPTARPTPQQVLALFNPCAAATRQPSPTPDPAPLAHPMLAVSHFINMPPPFFPHPVPIPPPSRPHPVPQITSGYL
ncbi:unnamed protein product [Closterium sp. NIES-65]|nr:unnamed protein product [Closterium sp. NIES-65]